MMLLQIFRSVALTWSCFVRAGYSTSDQLPGGKLIRMKRTSCLFLSETFLIECKNKHTCKHTLALNTHVHLLRSVNDARELIAGDEQDKQAICLSAFIVV